MIIKLDEKHVKTHEEPLKAQDNLENLIDMGNDLVLESDLETDVHAHIANQLDPFGKKDRRKVGRSSSLHTRTGMVKTESRGKAARETRRGRGMPSMTRSIPRSD